MALGEAPRTWAVRRAVLAAAHALYRASVMHGDLAPRNILVAATDAVLPAHPAPLGCHAECVVLDCARRRAQNSPAAPRRRGRRIRHRELIHELIAEPRSCAALPWLWQHSCPGQLTGSC